MDEGGQPGFSLPANLTRDEAKVCLESLSGAIRGAVRGVPGVDFRVDASAVSRFDSSALAVLLEGRRLAASLGGGLVVESMPAGLGQLAALYGVAELLA